jgi:transcriptional regulator GlxA family with amidase domain
MSIVQVAQTCGFGTSSHFAHIFKLRMGSTPAEYRHKIQLKDDGKKA